MSEVKREPSSTPQRTFSIQAAFRADDNGVREALAALGGGLAASGSQNAEASGSGSQSGQASGSGAQIEEPWSRQSVPFGLHNPEPHLAGIGAWSPGGGLSKPAKSNSRTTILFPQRTSFSTADEFFAECSKRLRAQYGYPANPSKRKDAKVTARCFCHKTSGCQFRVCALKQQDSSWFVQNKVCTWEHSHAPSTTPLQPSHPAASAPSPANTSQARAPPLVAQPAASTPSALHPPTLPPIRPSASTPAPPEPPTQPATTGLAASQLPASVVPPSAAPAPVPPPPPASVASTQPVPPPQPAALPAVSNAYPPSQSNLAAAPRPNTQAAPSTTSSSSTPHPATAPSPGLSSVPAAANPIPPPASLAHSPVAIAPAPRKAPNTESTPASAPTATPAQSAARTVILFSPGTSFQNDADFFSKCAEASCERFGVSTNVRNRVKTCIVACCARRQADVKCGYTVRAELLGGRWVLQHSKCNWTHDHDAGTQKESKSGLQLGARKKRIADDTSAKTGESPAHRKERIEAPVAGVPSSSETFASLTEVYCRLVVAYTKALGISVNKMPGGPNHGSIRCNRLGAGCPFKVVVNEDAAGRLFIDHGASDWRHNHGKHPSYAADPTWRPVVKNQDAKAALGDWLTPTPSTSATDGNSGAPPAESAPAASNEPSRPFRGNQWTKARDQKLVDEAHAKGLPPPEGLLHHFEASRPAPPASAPAAAKRSSPTDAAVDAGPAKRPRVKEEERSPVQPSAALPSPALTTPDTVIHDMRAPLHHVRPTPAPFARSVTPMKPIIPSPRTFPELEPFLAGLHPTIIPLAPLLLSRGIGSSASLVDLALLSDNALDVVFEDLRRRIDDPKRDPDCRATVLQARLFIKAIKASPTRAQE